MQPILVSLEVEEDGAAIWVVNDTLDKLNGELYYGVSTIDAEEVAYFVSLTQSTACTLSMSLLPRHLSPEDYRCKVAMLYGAGHPRPRRLRRYWLRASSTLRFFVSP